MNVSLTPSALAAVPPTVWIVVQVVIGGVWVFHGLYSKLLGGIPRHQTIIARVLGARHAQRATNIIGLLEVALGGWVFTGWYRGPCALVQTVAILVMNIVEIAFAADLLISAVGMLVLNAGFLSLVWAWALSPRQ